MCVASVGVVSSLHLSVLSFFFQLDLFINVVLEDISRLGAGFFVCCEMLVTVLLIYVNIAKTSIQLHH